MVVDGIEVVLLQSRRLQSCWSSDVCVFVVLPVEVLDALSFANEVAGHRSGDVVTDEATRPVLVHKSVLHRPCSVDVFGVQAVLLARWTDGEQLVVRVMLGAVVYKQTWVPFVYWLMNRDVTLLKALHWPRAFVGSFKKWTTLY